jgi:hypothetical protein
MKPHTAVTHRSKEDLQSVSKSARNLAYDETLGAGAGRLARSTFYFAGLRDFRAEAAATAARTAEAKTGLRLECRGGTES